MRKIVLIAFMGLILQSSTATAADYQVNPEASSVKWTATKVTGEHYGYILLNSGVIHFEEGRFVGGEAEMNMASIAVADIQNPESNLKLVNHLKHADFFDVENYPKASIMIEQVEDLGDDQYQVKGNLTIKGVSEPVEFPATVTAKGGIVQASAVLKIDRTLYDVRYGSGKFFEGLGDKLIHDTFTLEVIVEAEE